MPSQRFSGALVACLTVTLVGGAALGKDANRDYFCDEDALTATTVLRIGRVRETLNEVPVRQSRIIRTGPATTRTRGTTTAIDWTTTWGRCPILPDECEPRGNLRSGQYVTMWERKGTHLCVGHIGGTGWVEASTIEELPKQLTEVRDWQGAFATNANQTGEIAMAAEADGNVSISGASQHSSGEGSGVLYFGFFEIPFTQVRPNRNSAEVRFVEGGAIFRDGEAPVWSPAGQLSESCPLTFRLQAPLLMVTDAHGCVVYNPSGFQGIWYPDRGGNPLPRADHSRTIQLSR